MTYLTEIEATNPQTGELCKWVGPRIKAESWNEAQNYLLISGLGYCKIIGTLELEIDTN